MAGRAQLTRRGSPPASDSAVGLRSFLVLAFGVACVSTAAVLIRLANARPLAIAAWRMALATALLLPIAASRYKRGRCRLVRAAGWPMVAAGACLALHFGLWISSLEKTSVASSVVLVCTNPLWVGLASPVVLGEKPSARLWSGILLAFAGGTAIAVADGGIGRHAVVGDLLALGGAWAAAAYFILGRRVRPRLPLVQYITVVYGVAAAFLFAVALMARIPLAGYDRHTWLCLGALALVPQLLGHSSFNWALRRQSATLVAGAVLGEVVGSVLLAWAVLGELPSQGVRAGGVVILAGLAVAVSADRPRARVTASDGEMMSERNEPHAAIDPGP